MVSKRLALVVAFLLVVPGCSSSGVAATDLAPIVERDGVPFEGSAIPNEVLLYLAGYPVVVIGETHLIREQRDFTAALVEGLWAHGYRQMLLEWPHMADWIVSEYVVDGDFAPGGWNPPMWLYGDLLEEIRDFNRGLAQGERMEVRGIDINLDNYGGAEVFLESLGDLSRRLPSRGPLGPFLEQPYDTPEAQTAALGSLQAALTAERDRLIDSWGQPWYERVNEMVEIEQGSVPVRTKWDVDPDESARPRERLMKQLADARLAGYEYGSVVNVGGNHAQKKRLKGTNHEWLGDYLVNRSTAPSGPVISVVVVPASITTDYPTDLPDWAVSDSSPANELFRIIHESWPGRTVFLPFADPIFREGKVAMNFEDTIHIDSPQRFYDAAVLLPIAHRIPIP